MQNTSFTLLRTIITIRNTNAAFYFWFLQGFNSGVALYDLRRMRASPGWGEEVVLARMAALTRQFWVLGTVGDQDWLTLLGWDRPELFYRLPCQYNVQTHEGYNTREYEEVWHLYRNCSAPSDPETKIIHRNGSW